MTDHTASRRTFLQSIGALLLSDKLSWNQEERARAATAPDASLRAFIEAHRKPDGGYGWHSQIGSHVTPTFAAVALYRMLDQPIPDPERISDFVTAHYPVPSGLSQQPLWRLDYEQNQVLLWLGQSMVLDKAPEWERPLAYNPYFEQKGYPTLQHQAMAVRLRRMAGSGRAEGTLAWLAYFRSRQRRDGTYNNTPADDGSGGHVVNTLWSIEALGDLGADEPLSAEAIAWIRNCQRSTGGFTWSPAPEVGGVENVIYTWAAVRLLARSGHTPADKQACVHWVQRQRDANGGYASSVGSASNLTAALYALDTLHTLGAGPEPLMTTGPAVVRRALPAGLRIYSAQIEAPGDGSPAEAVMLAQRLGVHLWAAKNSPVGWIATAQQIARSRGCHTLFAQGNEEYGTYTELPGLGMYSHLDDLVAPAIADLGSFPPEKNVGMPWTAFRDRRIKQVRQLDGRMVWQFNENEELTRILLDEACVSKSYAAISSFHFGLDNFLAFEPFLMEWEGRLPMIGLQDAHGGESWWWAAQLANFRTLYLAEDASWRGFVDAIDQGWCLSVRHSSQESTLQWSGASSDVRRYIEERIRQWAWWQSKSPSLPLAAVTTLQAGALFEAGAPVYGHSVRVRLQWNLGPSPNKVVFVEPLTELVSLSFNGQRIDTHEVATDSDHYLLARLPDTPTGRGVAVVRDRRNNQTESIGFNIAAHAEKG